MSAIEVTLVHPDLIDPSSDHPLSHDLIWFQTRDLYTDVTFHLAESKNISSHLVLFAQRSKVISDLARSTFSIENHLHISLPDHYSEAMEYLLILLYQGRVLFPEAWYEQVLNLAQVLGIDLSQVGLDRGQVEDAEVTVEVIGEVTQPHEGQPQPWEGQPDPELTCQHCNINFFFPADLQAHNSAFHPIFEAPTPSIVTPHHELTPHPVPLTSTPLPNHQRKKAHGRKALQARWAGQICDSCERNASTSASHYREHLSTTHYKDRIETLLTDKGMCPFCNYDGGNVLRHVGATHKAVDDFVTPEQRSLLSPAVTIPIKPTVIEPRKRRATMGDENFVYGNASTSSSFCGKVKKRKVVSESLDLNKGDGPELRCYCCDYYTRRDWNHLQRHVIKHVQDEMARAQLVDRERLYCPICLGSGERHEEFKRFRELMLHLGIHHGLIEDYLPVNVPKWYKDQKHLGKENEVVQLD